MWASPFPTHILSVCQVRVCVTSHPLQEPWGVRAKLDSAGQILLCVQGVTWVEPRAGFNLARAIWLSLLLMQGPGQNAPASSAAVRPLQG